MRPCIPILRFVSRLDPVKFNIAFSQLCVCGGGGGGGGGSGGGGGGSSSSGGGSVIAARVSLVGASHVLFPFLVISDSEQPNSHLHIAVFQRNILRFNFKET